MYKLTSYRLKIYGSLDKDVAYTSECRDLISSNNLGSNVFLCGFGNAKIVLTEGWIFLNSSLSEGLPLALGEAGLAGLPVVCTDVGGSKEVVTGPEGVFGAIVPPRRPDKLAMAQMNVMAMLGSIHNLVADNSGECPEPTPASHLLILLENEKSIGLKEWNKFGAFGAKWA